MVLILILSFLGAFAVIALPLMAAGGSSAKGQKRVMTALDDALGRARRGDGEAITDDAAVIAVSAERRLSSGKKKHGIIKPA